MANTSTLLYHLTQRWAAPPSFRTFFFFVPTILALFTSVFILFYISSTSTLFFFPFPPPSSLSTSNLRPPKPIFSSGSPPITLTFKSSHEVEEVLDEELPEVSPPKDVDLERVGSFVFSGINVNNKVFHDRDVFQEEYREMNRSFKIYVYPHRQDDPFANALLPVTFEPGGNYASESYFKKVLMKSHFITRDPAKADLFFLPFSIARLRHDPRVRVEGIQDFIKDYLLNASRKYPYWNRTGGADHFYVACHSIGRTAMEKVEQVKLNAIQVVCSSSYFLSGYIAHKDASIPQIWPRQEDPPGLASSERKKLAFFAGSINSPVRERLLQVWGNDTEISANFGRLTTPYSSALLSSKFCLHVKGFEVNTARIADSLYYGCVPVIIANHYDLPFADILNWKSFSVVVATLDIPLLKKVLLEIDADRYRQLQTNVLEVRKHFQWHESAVDYDAFYMVMYELWLRRSVMRLPLTGAGVGAD